MSESGEVDEWITDIEWTLRVIKNEVVKTGSICRVPEKIREASKEKSEEWYRPKFVAMGPIHRGTTIDLQTMELTKWRYMDKLLSRLTTKDKFPSRPTPKGVLIQKGCIEIKQLESIIRASYGDTIHMGTEEFARIMLLDACFLLELLLRLSENHNVPSDMGYINDNKKMSRLLTDLMLLENQVPFLLLYILSTQLIRSGEKQKRSGEKQKRSGEQQERSGEQQERSGEQQEPASLVALSQDRELSPKKLAESLFGCNVASDDFTDDVCHFLHFIHLCSPDPYKHQDILSKHPLQLHRSARKLQAFGITIKTSETKDYEGNINMASASREFMDKFEFKIDFNETQRELIIPTLLIKEATEVKWRNFIAWEQIGWLIGVGYKFTSYAYFFKGLVCSVHDIRLLKEKGVIRVHTEAKDEDLLIMFQSIVTGAKHMDARYTGVCERLNKAKVNGVGGCCVLIFRMSWHYWRRFLEWLQRGLISMLLSFIDIYLGTPWKFIGVVSGMALLVLTLMQTIYASRGRIEI